MKEKCEHNAYNKCLLPTAIGQITILFSIFGTELCLSTSLAKPAVSSLHAMVLMKCGHGIRNGNKYSILLQLCDPYHIITKSRIIKRLHPIPVHNKKNRDNIQ